MKHLDKCLRVSITKTAGLRFGLCFMHFRACFKTPKVTSLLAKQNQNYINTWRAFHQDQQSPMAQYNCNKVSCHRWKFFFFKLLSYGRFTWSWLKRNYVPATDQIKPNKLHLSSVGSNISTHNKHISSPIYSEYSWQAYGIELSK